MEKIPTIFDRDWNGNRKVINTLLLHPYRLEHAIATEKLDGSNVRLTVRNGILVRLEKRRNPDKIQKLKGIKEPWYVDADEFATSDKHLWDAARNTDLKNIEDGEFSGEALGPSIQGNPLNLPSHRVVLFLVAGAIADIPIIENVPTTFEELKAWLPLQQSSYGTGSIEGIVWWDNIAYEPIGKIKTKDFDYL